MEKRIIKFRGKCLKTEEWVYGGYYDRCYNDKGEIYENGWHDVHIVTNSSWYEWAYKRLVITETVGQFTGLRDCNGVEIYEGDIIAGSNGSINGYECPFKMEIRWSEELHGFNLPSFGSDHSKTHYYNVIGNIHDNPDLLTKK